MSHILDIIDGLSKMTVGSPAVATKDVNEVKLTLDESALPTRLLMPSLEGNSKYVGMGTLKHMTWQIQDLCLFARVAKGTGINQYAQAMVQYLEDYLTALKSKRSPYANSHITGISAQMAPVQWSDVTYWGVNIILTVEEIL